MVQSTLLHHFDTFNRILACRDTFLAKIVREALALARFDPAILAAIDGDIEQQAREVKKTRIMDEIFAQEGPPRFPQFADRIEPEDFCAVEAATLGLDQGRPRAVDAELVLVLAVINGVFSVTSRTGYQRLIESEVFSEVLQSKGMKTPARTTVAKYLETVSEQTHELIHRALYRKVSDEELDEFTALTVDSTAMESNSAWPTESALIVRFFQRIHTLMHKQADYTGAAYRCKLVDRWLEQMETLHKSINLLPCKPGSRAERAGLYKSLLEKAQQTRAKLRELLDRRLNRINDCCILPSHRQRVNLIMDRIEESFDEAGKAMASARRRTVLGKSTAAQEKAFSVADPDAYMIEKGGREPVLGYKPQIGRSAEGFISCHEIERGNPQDSTRLQPMVREHRRVTGITPFSVSTDDGYSSGPNFTALRAMGVQRISFSGATGRSVLGEEKYRHPDYEAMRKNRSAVESTIFTFKHLCNMRRFCRRGLQGVRKDLSEAVLAYNLWRMSYVREHRHRRSPKRAA